MNERRWKQYFRQAGKYLYCDTSQKDIFEKQIRAAIADLQNEILSPSKSAYPSKTGCRRSSRIFHLKADKMRQLYQQLRNKYQMHCAYAQGNAKMREAYNKWRDPRRRQWSNTR